MNMLKRVARVSATQSLYHLQRNVFRAPKDFAGLQMNFFWVHLSVAILYVKHVIEKTSVVFANKLFC